MTRVHLRIGKSGITDGIIEELNHQFEHSDPLTIKFLKNFREAHDRKTAAQELAQRTHSTVKRFVGGTLILTRNH